MSLSPMKGRIESALDDVCVLSFIPLFETYAMLCDVARLSPFYIYSPRSRDFRSRGDYSRNTFTTVGLQKQRYHHRLSSAARHFSMQQCVIVDMTVTMLWLRYRYPI